MKSQLEFDFRVQANYLLWRVVKSMVSFLTDDLRKRKMQYVTAMTGSTEEEPRWKECVEFSTERYNNNLYYILNKNIKVKMIK